MSRHYGHGRCDHDCDRGHYDGDHDHDGGGKTFLISVE